MKGTMMQGLSIFNKGRGAPAVWLGLEIDSVNATNNLRLVHKAIIKARKNKGTRHIPIG